jgi:cell wall-associated NlpC family hydrolase
VLTPPTYRDRFLAAVEQLLGMVVLWGAKDGLATDCSGSVTRSLKAIGGPDLTHCDNAQKLHDETRLLGAAPTDQALPGDLVFYGFPPTPAELAVNPAAPPHIEHVAVVDEFGGVISADGATSHITSFAAAQANPANRVRRHSSRFYRRDTPLVVTHRNLFVDALDGVSR